MEFLNTRVVVWCRATNSERLGVFTILGGSVKKIQKTPYARIDYLRPSCLLGANSAKMNDLCKCLITCRLSCIVAQVAFSGDAICRKLVTNMTQIALQYVANKKVVCGIFQCNLRQMTSKAMIFDATKSGF